MAAANTPNIYKDIFNELLDLEKTLQVTYRSAIFSDVLFDKIFQYGVIEERELAIQAAATLLLYSRTLTETTNKSNGTLSSGSSFLLCRTFNHVSSADLSEEEKTSLAKLIRSIQFLFENNSKIYLKIHHNKTEFFERVDMFSESLARLCAGQKLASGELSEAESKLMDEAEKMTSARISAEEPNESSLDGSLFAKLDEEEMQLQASYKKNLYIPLLQKCLYRDEPITQREQAIRLHAYLRLLQRSVEVAQVSAYASSDTVSRLCDAAIWTVTTGAADEKITAVVGKIKKWIEKNRALSTEVALSREESHGTLMLRESEAEMILSGAPFTAVELASAVEACRDEVDAAVKAKLLEEEAS